MSTLKFSCFYSKMSNLVVEKKNNDAPSVGDDFICLSALYLKRHKLPIMTANFWLCIFLLPPLQFPNF
jgi:hypothetical protein